MPIPLHPPSTKYESITFVELVQCTLQVGREEDRMKYKLRSVFSRIIQYTWGDEMHIEADESKQVEE